MITFRGCVFLASEIVAILSLQDDARHFSIEFAIRNFEVGSFVFRFHDRGERNGEFLKLCQAWKEALS